MKADSIIINRRALLSSVAFSAFAFPALALSGALYKNSGAPTPLRVSDLLGRMSLAEKIAQLRCVWFEKKQLLDDNGAFSAARASAAFPDGLGQIAHPGDFAGSKHYVGTGFRDAEDAVLFANAAQKWAMEQTRLGIPLLLHEEAAHGFVARDATCFPIPPALAGTWDPDLIEEVFTVAGREARLRGANVVLTPVLDLMRDPRWGRMEEFFSEDPFLTARMGVAAVRGLQGPERPIAADRVLATLKHFVHGTPEGGMNKAPFDVSERELRNTYLPPFEAAIGEAKAAVLMPSYNEVAGIPSHANKALLQEQARQRLRFDGPIFSDYGAVGELATIHKMAADLPAAAALALEAGVDVDLPEGAAFASLTSFAPPAAILTRIDAAVARVLALKFEAGLFERPYTDSARMRHGNATPSAIALARKVAERAIVLLKNDGVLPLDRGKALRLAIIGPNADAKVLGGYSGFSDRLVTILDGVRAVAGSNLQIEHAPGVLLSKPDAAGRYPFNLPMRPASEPENQARIKEAIALAARADIVLLVLGDNEQITRETTSRFTPGDRNSLELFGDQDALVEAMISAGKPIIALVLSGRPLGISRLAERANALVQGWYLGEQGGAAFANILFGQVNPSGKLSVSFPRSAGDLPVFYNRHPSAAAAPYVEEQPRLPTPLFPFGYGLSYTSFTYSAPRLQKSEINLNESAIVEVEVTNVGRRAGDEIVQLYIRDEISSAPRPVLELKGFQRLHLRAGEKRLARFTLGEDALAFWNADLERRVEPGAFSILTGPNSATLQQVRLLVRPG